MKKTMFYTQFGNPPQCKAHVNESNYSLVQPHPEITLREMVERYTRTGEVPVVNSHQVYYEDDVVHPQNFDLSDISESKDIINNYVDKVKKKGKSSFSGKGGASESGATLGVSKASDEASEPTASDRKPEK